LRTADSRYALEKLAVLLAQVRVSDRFFPDPRERLTPTIGGVALHIPRELTIEDGAYALDGGSILLSLRDMQDVQWKLVLVQHRIPKDQTDPRFPGRLYLDDQMIPVRSDEEGQLLMELKAASISPIYGKKEGPKEESEPMHVLSEDIADFLAATRISPLEAIKHLVDSLVHFVESEEYVRLAREFADDNSA